MNSPTREEINNLINNNDLILDLIEYSQIEDDICLYIYEKLKKTPNIGKIIWHPNLIINLDLKFKLENQLVKNNDSYTTYPSDFYHCLISYHVYTDTIKQNEILNNNNDTNDNQHKNTSITSIHDLVWTKLSDSGWSIYEIFEHKEYKSILYMNIKTKQLVLSFQGFQLQIHDFFSIEHNDTEKFVYSLLQDKDISVQTIFAYLHTKRAVDLSIQNGYHLSLTGYSFGAWLAEQSCFFCHKDFNKRNVRCVTFESPGSFEFLEKLRTSCIVNDDLKFELDDLDIKTYLSEPNFINTLNKHLGRVYRINTKNQHQSQQHNQTLNIDKMYSNNNESFKNVLSSSFVSLAKNAEPDIRTSYFIKGIKSILPEGLESFLESFESAPALTKTKRNHHDTNRLKQIINWPRTELKSSKRFRDIFKSLFDADNVLQLVPQIQTIPMAIKNLATEMFASSSNNQMTMKQNVEIVNDHLNSLSIVFNLVTEILNQTQINSTDSKIFEYFIDDLNGQHRPSKIENIFEKKNLLIDFDSHYKLKDANFHKEILNIKNSGSIDYYLERLSKLDDFTPIKDDLIRKQINKLRSKFKIEINQNRLWIHSKKLEIEKIKERLSRLLSLDEQLGPFIENYYFIDVTSSKNINLITFESYLPESKLKYFTGREKELRTIREHYLTKQYVCLHGVSGVGKTSLALQFAYDRLEKDPKLIVRWIDASCLQEILIDFKRIAQELKISTKDGIINSVRNKLNSQQKSQKYLFVLDNVLDELDIGELTSGFSKNIDFLLTTQNELIEINDQINFEKLQIKLFDRDESMLLVRKCLRVKITNQLSKSDWHELFDLLESPKCTHFSPFKLHKLVSVINEHSSWQLDDIKAFVTQNKHDKFYLMKTECPKAYLILSYLVYLNNNVSFELIRSVLIQETTMDILDAVDYLRRSGELSKTDTGFKVHEITQYEVHSNADQSNSSLLIDRITLAINNLLVKKDIEDSKSYIGKKLELLFKHTNKLFKFKWDTKFKTENNDELFKKMAKLSKEILFDYKSTLRHNLDELNSKKELYPFDYSKIAFCLNNIAVAYYCLDDFNKALEYYTEAFKIYSQNKNSSQVNIANCLHNIAVVNRHLDKYQVALDAYTESLKIKRQHLPANHTSIAMTLSNMGLVYGIF